MPTRIWPKSFDYLQHAKAFLISLCVILSLLLASLFIMIYSRTDKLILKRAREQAFDYVRMIKLIRLWSLDYGSVYVLKRPGVDSNIYLKRIGIKPDIKGEGGKVLTVRNHAIMTKEISRISEKREGVKFRITSLKPIDPGNAPDAYERTALLSFEKGAKEAYKIEQEPDKSSLFRYISPLYVDESCLECHHSQGYTVGNVIGAVSLSVPIDALLNEQRKNRLLIVTIAVVAIGFILSVCYFLTLRLVAKLDETQRNLKRQAATDELTGLKNRRRIMARLDEEYQRSLRLDEPLCLMIVDIDHFKRINDSHGHQFGDLVLKSVAARMQETLRKYDIIGRIGGEEFLIIAPSTAVEDAVILADRLRNKIGAEAVTDGETTVSVTVSAGVAIAHELDDTVESLLKRADNALYKAKHEGRNRVAVL